MLITCSGASPAGRHTGSSRTASTSHRDWPRSRASGCRGRPGRIHVGNALDWTPPRRFLAEWHVIAPESLTPYLYTFAGSDAVRHLFRLAAGHDVGGHDRAREAAVANGEEGILARHVADVEVRPVRALAALELAGRL